MSRWRWQQMGTENTKVSASFKLMLSSESHFNTIIRLCATSCAIASCYFKWHSVHTAYPVGKIWLSIALQDSNFGVYSIVLHTFESILKTNSTHTCTPTTCSIPPSAHGATYGLNITSSRCKLSVSLPVTPVKTILIADSWRMQRAVNIQFKNYTFFLLVMVNFQREN